MIKLLSLVLLGSTLSAVAQSPGTFVATGSMTTPRMGHTATLLKDGRVLIAGGYDGHSVMLASAELYDPSAGTFISTGTMAIPRWNHTATRLTDGRVLIAGGGTAELYDPSKGTFTPTGKMLTLEGHTATLLSNGQVLITRGTVDYRTGAPTELYDPATGIFTQVGSLDLHKLASTATPLYGGKILLAGGSPFGDASLYDPASGTFAFLDYFRIWSHSATLLKNGTVLVAGGADLDDWGEHETIGTAQIYDPSLGSFKPTGSLLESRDGHTATLLPSGLVLAAGGVRNYYLLLGSAELYDPAAGVFVPTGAMSVNRTSHTATLLPDGRVLITGGRDVWLPTPSNGRATADARATAELYIPPVRIISSAPGLSAPESNRPAGYALRIEPDGKQTVLSIQNTILLDDRPVYLILYATGIRNRSSLANVQVTIGGASVPVEYAGPEGSGIPGFDQVNLRLTPALRGLGVANLLLTVDGIASNTVLVDMR